jgi:alginate O-acetyltransferase complex protein AlgJ
MIFRRLLCNGLFFSIAVLSLARSEAQDDAAAATPPGLPEPEAGEDAADSEAESESSYQAGAGDAFAKRALEAAENAAGEGKRNVRGEDDAWFFLVQELRHLGAGDFWSKEWSEVAKNGQDPIPFLAQFNDQLKAKGIRLILAPVPPKASVYPEKLFADTSIEDVPSLRGFYDELEGAGLEVLDLESALRQLKDETGEKVYCEQDTHWSPLACEKAAELIAGLVSDDEWLQGVEKQEFVRSEEETLEIRGDQVESGDEVPMEKLTVRYAGIGGGGSGLAAVAPSADSPVLLIGDSHTLVFWEGTSGGMHTDRAGLLDELQYQFGFPIDHVGVRGSGSVMARRNLFRHADGHPGYWDGKKLVIWCFSAREFTQSIDKLIEIPLER